MQQKHQHEPGHTRAHRSELVDASCQLRVRNELHEEQIPQDETTGSRNCGTICMRGVGTSLLLPVALGQGLDGTERLGGGDSPVVDLRQRPLLRLAILRRHGWLPAAAAQGGLLR
jgi:hypothetical protein